MSSFLKSVLILAVLGYFFITTPPLSLSSNRSSNNFNEWWKTSESLLSSYEKEPLTFRIEGYVESQKYLYGLSKDTGDIELFGRLMRLIQTGGFFDETSDFDQKIIFIKITGNGESFERAFSKKEAESNYKLKLLFKILSENQNLETGTALAKDENPQNKKGS